MLEGTVQCAVEVRVSRTRALNMRSTRALPYGIAAQSRTDASEGVLRIQPRAVTGQPELQYRKNR